MDKIDWILIAHADFCQIECYEGKTYRVQGSTYPVTTHIRADAKKYTTKARAENACIHLNNKVSGYLCEFEVEKLINDGNDWKRN